MDSTTRALLPHLLSMGLRFYDISTIVIMTASTMPVFPSLLKPSSGLGTTGERPND